MSIDYDAEKARLLQDVPVRVRMRLSMATLRAFARLIGADSMEERSVWIRAKDATGYEFVKLSERDTSVLRAWCGGAG